MRAADLLPISRRNLERVQVNMLDEVIEEVARQFYADLAPAIDRVWDDGNRLDPGRSTRVAPSRE